MKEDLMGLYKPGRMPETCAGGIKPPAKSGEYRIINEKRIITYIGETNNLARRMGEHRRTGKLGNNDRFVWQVADGRSTSLTRRTHEREKIKKHSPLMNKSKGGEGRKAKKR
jgi:excinuclease UvrABC nuclease subunit